MSFTLSAGAPFPLGATLTAQGVNFALASEHAEKVELVFLDATGQTTISSVFLPVRTQGVFHGFLEGSPSSLVGLLYGFRVYGEYAPEKGHHFNPAKLLIDPYALELQGTLEWDHDILAYNSDTPLGYRSINTQNSLPYVPKARVSKPLPPIMPSSLAPWRHDEAHTVIYELHVKGFSKLNSGVPERLRGTYAGLAHPASIERMKALGVTTLSLLPVTYAVDERFLVRQGRINYWGYNPIAFFAIAPRYSCTPEDPTATRHEFRAMVDALHAAGLEVLMDVVYNHTAEGGERGPAISFRGIDHATYYRLCPGDPLHCENLTGCGNTLNASHPRVTQLILDSLRHWVTQYGIDGFRFDLAATLGRTDQGFSSQATFFTAMQQDPVLNQVKMIAEPWDIGYGGYQLGRFPRQFQEWNDKFRDSMRRYWLTGETGRGEFTQRLCASSDLFSYGHRNVFSSINYISSHDGFTLADMTSYNSKHNEANGEDNRDGRSGEPAYNCGVEGATDAPEVLQLRAKMQRALLATLFLSRGTPMIRAGDEIAQSQQGNNNAYCQDNSLSWIYWTAENEGSAAFVAKLIRFRQSSPWLTAPAWLDEHAFEWRTPNGTPMRAEDWHNGAERSIALCFGPSAKYLDRLLLLFNPHKEKQHFVLPDGDWRIVLDTAQFEDSPVQLIQSAGVDVEGHSLCVLLPLPAPD